MEQNDKMRNNAKVMKILTSFKIAPLEAVIC